MRYCFCLVFFFFFIKLVIGFNKRSAGEDTHIGVMKRDKKNEDDNEKEEYKKNNRFEKVKKKKNYRQKPDYGKEGPPLNEEGKFNDTVIEEKFNKGYNKYKKYFETSDNPEQEKQRRNNFKKNSNSIRVIQLDKSRKFQVDDESVFLFMSEEEKGTFKGLGNITEMESELPVKSIRPAPVSTSNVLSKISNRNNGNSPSKHSNATTVNTGEDVSSLEKREDETTGILKTLDLRSLNLVTAVKYQQGCGSCWAFAAVAVLEGVFALETGLTRTFSEQEVINCNEDGCDGGYWTRAWKQIRDAQYIALQSDKTYKALNEETCDVTTTNGLTDVMNIGSWSIMREQDAEVKMLGYLNTYGPVAVVILAEDWLYYYKKGIINFCLGGKDKVNHVVTIVGYDEVSLLIKNSWGTGWGEDGYFRLKRGCGVMGYSYWASYLSLVNIGGGQPPFAVEKEAVPIVIQTLGTKIRTTVTLGEIISQGDVFQFEISESAKSHSNVKIRLFAEDGATVYSLYVYRAESGRYCRERTIDSSGHIEKNVRSKCPLDLATRNMVEITVAESGFSAKVGPNQLKLFAHSRPYRTITTLYLGAGKLKMIDRARRIRSVISTNELGDVVIETCYNKDGTCDLILEEGLAGCAEGDSVAWMRENCALTCQMCTP